MIKKIAFASVSALIVIAPMLAQADVLTRSLDLGSTGSDVSSLQTYLASDITLYPQGLVTGYFGALTAGAVGNFQIRNGIVSSGTPKTTGFGRVGPTTLATLNAKMSGTVSTVGAPGIFNLTTSANGSSATINWTTNELAQGVIYYSTSPLVTYENDNSVNVSGSTVMTDTVFRAAQSVSIQGLQPNTTYYYLIYATDQSGKVSVTWPTTFRTTN